MNRLVLSSSCWITLGLLATAPPEAWSQGAANPPIHVLGGPSATSLTLAQGELRWEGVVRSVSLGNASLRMGVEKLLDPSGQATYFRHPAPKTVLLAGDTVIYRPDDPTRGLQLDDLSPGAVVVVVGREDDPQHRGVARVIAVRSLPLRGADGADGGVLASRFGYMITPPGGWTWVDRSGEGAEWFAFLGPVDGGFPVRIDVISRPADAGSMTLPAADRLGHGIAPDSRVVDTHVGKGAQSLHVRDIYTLRNGYVYDFRLTAPPEVFDRYLPVYQRSVRSVSWPVPSRSSSPAEPVASAGEVPAVGYGNAMKATGTVGAGVGAAAAYGGF